MNMLPLNQNWAWLLTAIDFPPPVLGNNSTLEEEIDVDWVRQKHAKPFIHWKLLSTHKGASGCVMVSKLDYLI